MSVLLLTEDDVRRLLTMDDALEAVEAGLRKLALDEADNIPRSRCRTDHAMLHVLPAAAQGLGYLGYKAYVTTRHGARFHVALYDGRGGELLALIQADYLGQVRTGAASGVATKYLARPEAATVGLYGTGKQARTQLQAVCKVRPVQHALVYSRSEERRRRFAAEMSEACGVDVVPVDRPESAARDLDIVITATSSAEPVLHGDWLAGGTHLNVIGSNYLAKAEVDVATLRRASLIVVDSKDQARLEAGDLVPAIDEGVIHWADVPELGAVVLGRARGRQRPQDITLFKSLGIAIEDVAVAARVYALAKERGVGREIEW
jgi:ornithine cyclodeaminase/alanine dehydrogenase-like protein (mu-crystallin family)